MSGLPERSATHRELPLPSVADAAPSPSEAVVVAPRARLVYPVTANSRTEYDEPPSRKTTRTKFAATAANVAFS